MGTVLHPQQQLYPRPRDADVLKQHGGARRLGTLANHTKRRALLKSDSKSNPVLRLFVQLYTNSHTCWESSTQWAMPLPAAYTAIPRAVGLFFPPLPCSQCCLCPSNRSVQPSSARAWTPAAAASVGFRDRQPWHPPPIRRQRCRQARIFPLWRSVDLQTRGTTAPVRLAAILGSSTFRQHHRTMPWHFPRRSRRRCDPKAALKFTRRCGLTTSRFVLA